jgi:hypothetical protein
MRIASLLAAFAFVAAGVALPASADTNQTTTEPQAIESVSPEACPMPGKGTHVAQLSCCKAHKGICGCRAGKLVCCDNTTSSETGCACHGDEGVIE